jgi:hypothetical protein
MIVQPREPNPGSMLEHAADADARRYEPWVTDAALWLDEDRRIRLDLSLVGKLLAEREPDVRALLAEREPDLKRLRRERDGGRR